MNTALLKAKMDKFFAEVSPEYLVKEFEKMGYTFIDSDVNWEQPENYNLITEHYELVENGILNRIFRSKKRMNLAKKLTSDYPGSFFCLKLVA